MSTVRYARDGLVISTFAGPAEHSSPHSGSRMMIQIGSAGGYVQLTMDHWIDLVCFVRRLDDRGYGITNAPEVTGG